MKKIGEVNFKNYKTEFFATKIVKDMLKINNLSEALLLPEGWFWYETILFDKIDENEDGLPDKKFGNNFKTIYYGTLSSRDYKDNILTEKTKLDGINLKKAIIKSEFKIKEGLDLIKFATFIK